MKNKRDKGKKMKQCRMDLYMHFTFKLDAFHCEKYGEIHSNKTVISLVPSRWSIGWWLY